MKLHSIISSKKINEFQDDLKVIMLKHFGEDIDNMEAYFVLKFLVDDLKNFINFNIDGDVDDYYKVKIHKGIDDVDN